MRQPVLELDRVLEMLLSALVLVGMAAALVALLWTGWASGSRWLRHRRSALARGETTFVGRLGRAGPELFVVGAAVRKLPLPRSRLPDACRREAGEAAAVFAMTMLTEALGRRPARDLAWSFVEERLAELPADGFVLETSDVIAWLDARHGATSEARTRVLEAAGASAARVASRLKPAKRPTVEGQVPRRREVR